MSRSRHITIEQGEQVLAEVKRILAPLLVTSDSQPKLYREWAWLGGERGPAVVWNDGPHGWPMLVYGGVDETSGQEFEPGRFAKQVEVEPITPFALGIYPH